MKPCLFVLLLLAGVAGAQPDSPVKQLDADHFEVGFQPHGEVRLHVQPSALRITGTDDNKITAHFWGDIADPSAVKVRLAAAGKTAEVSVNGGPRNNFHVEIQVPKKSDLYLRIGAGDVDVLGITGDKDIEMGAGDLTVEVGDPSAYGRVDASVTTGDLNASAFDVSKGGLFRSFHKQGDGPYRLHVHLGAGQLTLVR
jgi:hypothetical protein